jgi:hypothetical protein
VHELDAAGDALDDGVVDIAGDGDAAIGTAALVRPLAMVRMSGVTPRRSEPKWRPMRPKPVMTSSKMSRMPWRSQAARRRSR